MTVRATAGRSVPVAHAGGVCYAGGMRALHLLPLVVLLGACSRNQTPHATSASSASASAAASVAATPDAEPAPPSLVVTALDLPGAKGAVSMDYMASDRAGGRVYVPAGSTGNVAVIDVATRKVSAVGGFPTAAREGHGAHHMLGPSSAALGDGFLYVGDRANAQVCAVDTAKLARGACVTLKSTPDGVAYVAATKEVWVTVPRQNGITILDAATPARLTVKSHITLGGRPEGYAVDGAHGLFFTNLEDRNQTVAIDVHTRKVTATWEPRCHDVEPKGLAYDPDKGLLMVACADGLAVLDAGHGGKWIDKINVGAGVDNIDFLPARRLVYVASAKSGQLTVAHVDDHGVLSIVATAPTSLGARVVVADKTGAAYVADPVHGKVLYVAAP